MTHFKTLAATMYQLSDSMGDHNWQAGRAIDLLIENTEQHVYAARMMATAVLVAAKRLGIVRQDLDGLTGPQICHLLTDIERMATVAPPKGLPNILREAAAIIAAIPQGHEPENIRYPIYDELMGFAEMLDAPK